MSVTPVTHVGYISDKHAGTSSDVVVRVCVGARNVTAVPETYPNAGPKGIREPTRSDDTTDSA